MGNKRKQVFDFLEVFCEQGFSMTTIKLRRVAFTTTLDRKSYNLFAARTLFKLVLVRFGKPSGKSGDLKGTGPESIFPLGPLIFIFLARLHVPQGGAAKMPAKFGVSIQVMNRAWPALVVRSAIIIGAIELNFL